MTAVDGFDITVVAVLVAISALLVAGEVAIGRVSRSRVDELRRDGSRRATALVKLLDNRARYVNVLLLAQLATTAVALVIATIVALDVVPASRPWAVVLAAGASDSAKLVKGLRAAGYKGPVFGGPWMGRRQFMHEAGAAAEGCLFPLLFAAGKQSENFVAAFSRRCGAPPDYASAHTYDAVRQVVAALRKAGLNRARAYDALRSLSPWEGVSGVTAWENQGAATQAVGIGTIVQGRVVRAE